jgi:hypothetical protein
MKHLLSIAAMLGAICYANAQGAFEAVHPYPATSGGSMIGSGTGGTIGWTFEPLTEIRLTDLGCFQSYAQNNGAVQVGLWTDTGTLLASNLVSATDQLINLSVYQPVTPVVLASNTVYRIGLHALSGSTPFSIAIPPSDGAISMSSDIQLNSAVNAESGFTSPGGSLGDGMMFVGPNFRYDWTIPEPSTGTIFGLGVLALVARRKTARR